MQNEVNWVALGLALGPRSPLLKPLLRRFGGAAEILEAGGEAILATLPRIGKGILHSLVADESVRREAKRLVDWCHQSGVRIVPYGDALYPAAFAEIAEPPAVLYCMGKLPLPTGRPTVGVVGMRRIDAYGERVTYRLSFELAAAGVVTVSGMAQGADGIAAAATLDAGGHTVAVLGSGIDVIYPPCHQRLFWEIAEFGTVLTEYPPGTPPNSWNFPMRNRLISALSDALVVTEANVGSGALITARCALMQGKALFAVPGDVDSPRSSGTNGLLRSGALLALEAEDILAHFRFLYPNLAATVPPEAMQFTEATVAKLRARGIASVQTAEGDSGSSPDKVKRSRGTASGKAKPQGVGEREALPEAADSLSEEMLDHRQRELFRMLPTEEFSVDYLVARGVGPGEAAAVLTVLELYGMLVSLPGGLYRKK